MSAMSDYLENKLLDFLLRGQTFTAPTSVFVGLMTTNESDANSGQVEVSGGSYARVSISSALANWAGTQSAGSTTVSSGTSGTTSNNGAITFPAPTANWGVITGMGVFDASTSGNLLFYSALTASKTVNNGDSAPSFAGKLDDDENSKDVEDRAKMLISAVGVREKLSTLDRRVGEVS